MVRKTPELKLNEESSVRVFNEGGLEKLIEDQMPMPKVLWEEFDKRG